MTRIKTGGLAVMSAIRAYGIDTIFGIPGTHNLEFYRPLAELGITPITTRHEQGAGYAADGWSQRRGLPGVAITTSGPGLLNIMSAAGTAFSESRPLLILSPGVPAGTAFDDSGKLHETKNPTGAVGAVAHWSRRVTSAEEAVQAVHDAFALFETGHPRPVHIEVPIDVLEKPAQLDETILRRKTNDLLEADEDALDVAAQMLNWASRPMIVAGGGATSAAAALTVLAETLCAPVVTTLNGKGAIAESHPLSLRSELRLKATADYLDTADVLLVVGSKLGEAELWGNALPKTAAVVRIDLDPARMNVNLHADAAVVGDSRLALPRLQQRLNGKAPRPDNVGPVRRAQAAEARQFSPAVMRAAEAITTALPAGATVTGDSSQITYYGMSSTVHQDQPKKFLYMATYATLGYGLPAAIGAAIAEPGATTVCVVGDGALMFSLQELLTAAQQRLNLTIVCVDNGGYREIRENELDAGIEPTGVDLLQPNWAMLATACGCSGRTTTKASAVTGAIAEAIASPGVTLVHVPMALFDDPQTATTF